MNAAPLPAIPAPAAPPLAGEEFFSAYGDGGYELIDGVATKDPTMPSAKHGAACANIAFHLKLFVAPRNLGTVCANDPLFRLARNPDTVRAPDVCFASKARMPGAPPDGICDLVPELVFEVRSPGNTWQSMLRKASEYLEAGAVAAVVVDLEQRTATVFRAAELPQTFDNGDEFSVPDALPGFAVPLRSFFE